MKNLSEEVHVYTETLQVPGHKSNLQIILHTLTTSYKREDINTIEHEERGDL